MNDIEDRAVAWSEQHRDIYMCNADVIAEVSYKQGATEQHQIDIDKACDWLLKCESLQMRQYNIKEFRKAMSNEN